MVERADAVRRGCPGVRSCTRPLSISASPACGACVGEIEPPPAIWLAVTCAYPPPLSSGPSVGSRYRDTFDSPQRRARGLSLTCSILGDRHSCEANGAAARPRAASREHRSDKRGAKRPPVLGITQNGGAGSGGTHDESGGSFFKCRNDICGSTYFAGGTKWAVPFFVPAAIARCVLSDGNRCQIARKSAMYLNFSFSKRI